MKYLKLFEDFDVYAFRKYTNDDNVDLDKVLMDLKVQQFSNDDIDLIGEKCNVKVSNTNKNVYIELDNTNYANAWYLGDYCYAIIGMNTYNSKPTFIQTFDQIDALIDGINELIIDYSA